MSAHEPFAVKVNRVMSQEGCDYAAACRILGQRGMAIRALRRQRRARDAEGVDTSCLPAGDQ